MTEWGFAEHILEDIVAGMLGTEPSYVNALTANMATDYQIKSARSIGRRRFDEVGFKHFNTVLTYFERLAPFRNKLIHGFWSSRDEDNQYTVSTLKSGGTLRTQAEYVNLEYLRWMSRQVRALTSLLLGFGSLYGLLIYGDRPEEIQPELVSALAGEDDPFLWVV